MSNKSYKYRRSYAFSSQLKEYLDETLKLEKLKEKYKMDNSKMGVHDKRRIRNNDEKKVRILKNQIFKSLANLIYFFLVLNNNPKLVDKFSDDIKEIFGTDSITRDKYFTFSRLLIAMLGYNNIRKEFDNLDDQFIFRRRFLILMQKCINFKIKSIVLKSKEYDERFERMILSDMDRADVWTNFIDKSAILVNKKLSNPKQA